MSDAIDIHDEIMYRVGQRNLENVLPDIHDIEIPGDGILVVNPPGYRQKTVLEPGSKSVIYPLDNPGMTDAVDSMYDAAEELVGLNDPTNESWINALVNGKGEIDQYQNASRLRKEARSGAVLTDYGINMLKSHGMDPTDGVYGQMPEKNQML